MKTKIIWYRFRTSEKIMAAKMVAVIGCIKRPIDPSEADIFVMPIVIKYCPPNWHSKAKKRIFITSNLEDGIFVPGSRIIGTKENIQQKKVV